MCNAQSKQTLHLVYMWEIEVKVPRPRLSLHVISRAQCKFSHMFNMCTYCYDNELQGKTIFHTLGGGGKSRTLAWAAVALDLGLRLCLSLSLPFMIYLASHIGSIVPPLFLSSSPLSSSFTHPAIVGCQSINKQLTSDSSNSAPLPLSLSGIGIGTAHLLYFPSSPLAVCSMCISIHPNVITRFNMSAGGRGRVHYSAVFFIEVQRRLWVEFGGWAGAWMRASCGKRSHGYVRVFFYRYLYINIMRVPMISNGQQVNRHAPLRCAFN